MIANDFPFQQREFTATLTSSDPVVMDHCVHGIPTLPGVVLIDLVYRVARHMKVPTESWRLRRVLFHSPIRCNPSEEAERVWIRVRHIPEAPRCRIVVEYAEDNQEQWKEALNAFWEPIPESEAGSLQRSIDPTHTPWRSVEEVYEMAKSSGIVHQGFMEPSGDFVNTENGTSARLRLSLQAEVHLSDFYLHPALMDAATVMGAASQVDLAVEKREAFIPFYIEQFEARGPLTPELCVHVESLPTSTSGDLHSVHLTLTNPQGDVLAVFRKLDAKRVRLSEWNQEILPETTPDPVPHLVESIEAKSAESGARILVLQQISQRTGADVDRIPGDVGFYDLGLSSADLVQMVAELEQEAGADLYPTLLFEYPTVDQAVAWLEENHPAAFRSGASSINTNVTKKRSDTDPTKKTHLNARKEDIAIIGMSGRFPKAPDLESFWNNLEAGLDCIDVIPGERWDWRDYHAPYPGSPGKSFAHWGGWLEQVDCFDAKLFRISPRDAERMDPQERLFLEIVWEALENAGYPPRQFGKRHEQRVGVFTGAMWRDYAWIPTQQPVGAWTASIANRVSYCFNLNGPSVGLDTMCSTALVAIHHAVQSLRNGECIAAIAGGVNLSLSPRKYNTLSELQMLAPDGRCRSFGAGGQGYVPGEGVGAVVLKTVSQAVADGDRIDAVIRGTAINHGGASGGFTVPSPNAQKDLLLSAWENAGVSADEISYIEAHGTGTSLGDPIEIQSLTQALKEAGTGLHHKWPVHVGSVKSNVGHLESAAGIAAVIKTVLQMQRRTLVPSIHSQTLNPNINWDQAPVHIPQQVEPWSPAEATKQRIAGISSFGAGGTNAHIVLQEAPAQSIHARHPAPDKLIQQNQGLAVGKRSMPDKAAGRLFPFSAQTRDALTRLLKKFQLWLETPRRFSLPELAWTLQTGRESMSVRCVIVAETFQELKDGLAQICQETDPDAQPGLETVDENPEIAEKVRLWLSGSELDWRQIWKGALRPISAPTYAFARDRYWLSDVGVDGAAKESHSQNSAPGSSSLFWKSEFESTFLNDHRLNGIPLAPGAAFIARALQFCQDTNRDLSICHVEWLRPVSHAGSDLELREASDFLSLVDRNTEEIFARARLGVAAKSALEWSFDFSEWKLESSDEIYQGFTRSGLEYGPSLRLLRQWRIASDHFGCIGEWAPEEGLDWTAIIDLALQTVAPLLPRDKQIRVPAGIQSVVVHSIQHKPFRAKVQRSGDSNLNYNIQLESKSGETIVTLSGVRFAGGIGVRSKAPEAVVTEHALMAIEPYWKPSPLLSPTSDKLTEFQWIAFDQTFGEITESSSEIGSSFNVQIKNSPEHVANLDEFETREKLKRWIESAGYDPNQPVGFLTSLPSSEWKQENVSEVEILENWDRWVDVHLKAPLIWLQTWLSMKPKSHVRWVLHLPETSTMPGWGESLAGLARSISLENPLFQISIVQGTVRQAMDELLKGSGQPVEAHYRDGSRETLALREFDRSANAKSNRPIWKPNGVYWIIGGLGGLGWKLACELIERHGVAVALTGRRHPDVARLQEIESLRERGARIQTWAVDVTRPVAMRRVRKLIHEHMGSIRGVIYSAGVIRDGFAVQKDLESMEDVCRAKVLGAQIVDQILANEPLDFFALMGSLSGLLGNAGQIDYAIANHYLGKFAEWRNQAVLAGQRTGSTVCLDWPLLDGLGMQVDAVTAATLKKTSGLVPLPLAQVMDVLEESVRSEVPRLGWVYGDLKKLTTRLGVDQAERMIAPEPALFQETPESSKESYKDPTVEPSPQTRAVVSSQRLDELKTLALEQMEELLKIRPEDVDFNAQIDEFGFDSITLSSLVQSLNDRYALEMSPAVFYEHGTLNSFLAYVLELANDSKPFVEESRSRPEVARSEPASTAKISQNHLTKPTATSHRHSPIAVLGMAGMGPGFSNLDGMWRILDKGLDPITEIPADRWDWKAYDGDPILERNKTYARWGGFANGALSFDPEFFGISFRDAELMDPQQRLFLQETWRALEDAGIRPSDLRGFNTGVFVGAGTHDYAEWIIKSGVDIQAGMGAGLARSMIANRLSFWLDLKGPSENIDTACSSSLVALNRAILALRTGQCDRAIVGGVNVMLTPTPGIAFSQSGMLSKTGRCRVFSDDADGYVRSEGCFVVVLARADDPTIQTLNFHAKILGCEVAHGGRANSLTAPNPLAQAELLNKTWKASGINPDTLDYIETHGTGTPLGDPIEINGLRLALQQSGIEGVSPSVSPISIGSVKSHLGHLETAAGLAGLVKVVLCLENQTLPANLWIRQLNPNIELGAGNLEILTQSRPWNPRSDRPRRAAVSSFGFGGSNAHAVIEEASVIKLVGSNLVKPLPFILSAKTAQALRRRAQDMYEWIQNHGAELRLQDVCRTLCFGRESMSVRIGKICSSAQEVVQWLGGLLANWIDPYQEPTAKELNSSPAAKTTESKSELLNQWLAGEPVDWIPEFGESAGRMISLPAYRFEEIRCQVQPDSENVNPTSVQSKTVETHSSQKFDDDSSTPASSELLALKPGFRACSISQPAPDWPGESRVTWISSAYVASSTSQVDEDWVTIESLEASNFYGWFVYDPGQALDANPSEAELANQMVDRLRVALKRMREVRPDGKIVGIILSDGSIGHRSLVGMLRSVRFEDPFIQIQLLEIHGSFNKEDCMRELSAVSEVSEVRYQDGERLESCWEVADSGASGFYPRNQVFNSDRTLPIRSGAVCILAGGLGELGIELGGWLFRNFGARLVFLSRSLPGPEQDLSLKELQSQGADVLTVAADVTQLETLHQALNAVRKQWGGIHAVFHLARHGGFESWDSKSVEDWRSCTAPKTFGTEALDTATENDDLDAFVVFSSMSAATGLPWAADYTWSCDFQRHWIEQRQEQVQSGKRRGVSLALLWSQWNRDRYSDPERDQNLKSIGLDLLRLPEDLDVLTRSIPGRPSVQILARGARESILSALNSSDDFDEQSQPTPAPGATEIEVSADFSKLTDEELDAWIRELLATETDQSPARSEGGRSSFNKSQTDAENGTVFAVKSPGSKRPESPEIRQVPDAMESGTSNELDRATLMALLKRHFSNQWKISPEAIREDREFSFYGLDSIGALQISVRLGKALRMPVEPKLFLEKPTLNQLADTLWQRLVNQEALR